MKKHISIDFEGEGKRRDNTIPHPSLLGALVPNSEGAKCSYYLWVFEKNLAPITKSTKVFAKKENRKLSTLEEALKELHALANINNCQLIAYSEHELNVVKAHLPAESPARQQFEENFYNIRPKTKSLVNRRRLKVEDNKLESLVRALAPKYKWPPAPKCGAAEACRRLRKAGAKSKKWGKWSITHKQLAIDLIAYNRGDCRSVCKLTNRVSSNYKIQELE